MASEKTRRYVVSKWEVATYDVWGNAKEGYDVNNVYRHGTDTLRLPIWRHNVGTEHEFESAHPEAKHIRKIFGVRCRLDIEGDDINVYVNRERDSYPIGELRCVSHESLSPIRKATADKPKA